MDTHLQHIIAKARILGLAFDTTLPIHLRSIIQSADNEGRPLSETELQTICQFSSIDSEPLFSIQEQASTLVTAVKQKMLLEDPQLVKPGGALYPESRAEACWRDCWHFLRIAVYAAAADRTVFTHPPGVVGMAELYRELAVPIDSMARALSYLRETAVALYSSIGGGKDVWRLDASMRHLEVMMNQFSNKTAMAEEPAP